VRLPCATVRGGASRCRGSCEEAVTRRQDWTRLDEVGDVRRGLAEVGREMDGDAAVGFVSVWSK
jgi:hypothetical protein